MQLNKLIDLSIVIPVYNSEKILFYLTKKIDQNINKKIINKYEIIVVDDFSNDKSWNTIQKLSRKYKNIKGIKLKKNHGQHGSVFVGLKNSSGRKTIIMDDDLQHNPSYIMKIYKKLDCCDVCYTKYIYRKHNNFKIFASNFTNLYLSLILNKKIKVYCSTFKGINLRLKNKVIKFKKSPIYLDSLLIKFAKKIITKNTIHDIRFSGNSNYNLKNLFRLLFDAIENYHFKPKRIGSFIGLLSFLFVKLLRISKIKNKKQYEIDKKNF